MKKGILLLVASTIMLMSCGGGASTNSSESAAKLSGEVVVDGSSTVAPVTQAVAEEFAKENSEVNVSVGISGTGGGFKKFVKGEIDISDASRPIKTEKAKEAKKNGIEFL